MNQATFDYMLRCAKTAPSADNTQPWQFHQGRSGLLLSYAERRVAGTTFDSAAPATLLAIGALLENLCQGALGAEFDVSIERWPEGPKGPYAHVSVLNSCPTALLDAVPALFSRHTNRNAFHRRTAPRSVALQVQGAGQGLARTAWVEGANVADFADLVREASQVRFQTRDVHEWLAKSLRFTREEVSMGDGLDVATLALPPGGVALLRFLSPWRRMRALNRVGTYRLLAAIETAAIKAAPALVALVSPGPKDDLLDAGMLMERVWIALNSAGLAVQPYYVISDQLSRLAQGKIPKDLEGQVERVEVRCRALLGLRPEEQLQMLFRVGYPTRAAVRSCRLADSELVADYLPRAG